MPRSVRRFLGTVALAVVAAAISSASAQESKTKAGSPPSASGNADASKNTLGPKFDERGVTAAAWLEDAFKGHETPEAVRMLIAIARGSNMGSNDGWFGPAKSRYGWKWLAKHCKVSENQFISKDAFPVSIQWFDRLDRNSDGRIGADDLDWSDNIRQSQQAYMINRLFRKIDEHGDSVISREEWTTLFDKVAGSPSEVIIWEDFRDALLADSFAGFSPGDIPDQAQLVRGLFASELGSLREGPDLDARAPEFALRSLDGSRTQQLSELVGEKPVVLVLGNYTCGPFRSMYPGVDKLSRRFKDQANFLFVYVREAHPTDGWRMSSNDLVEVKVAQPKNYDERRRVAQTCQTRLQMTIPVVVDELDDRVGNLYSGMPGRFYVIDKQGKIAYKSGRGPMGFKVRELEQSLVMLMMDEQASKTAGKPVEAASR